MDVRGAWLGVVSWTTGDNAGRTTREVVGSSSSSSKEARSLVFKKKA